MKNKKKFVVIGNPIKHSLSPFLHNYWFKKLKLNCEYKKLKIIMNPAMIVTWLTGLSILWVLGFNTIFSLWLSIKFLFVIILSGYHGFLSKCLKDFALDRNTRSSKFFRFINEIPTIILIIIVFLVIFKPA